MGPDERDGGEMQTSRCANHSCRPAAQSDSDYPSAALFACVLHMQVLNLPVVRQFLFQPGDLPPPLTGRAGAGAALPSAPPPAVATAADLEPDDD